MLKCVVRAALFILLTLCFTAANAQEETLSSSVGAASVAKFSAAELLAQAKMLSSSDREASASLANEALRLSQDSDNYRVNAQAHAFLGERAQASMDTSLASHHFLEALLIYKKMNDKRNQIMTSIDYANVFFSEKHYDKGYAILDELLPIALQYGEELPIALILRTKGDNYYHEKRYDVAVAQYQDALTYLTAEDDMTQRSRGSTFHDIAQAYKHLKNHDQAIAFYKKARDLYAQLENERLMAMALKNIAMIERYRNNYIAALDYAIRGLEIQKQLNDPEALAEALFGVGKIYRYIGRYEKSLSHILKAHLYYKKVNDISNSAETSNQMGLIYTRLKEFDQARSFYQLTIDLPEESMRRRTRAAALREIAVIDLNAKDYEHAMIMAQEAYKIYQQEGDESKSAMTTRIIGNIYRDQDDSAQAITYYRKSLSLATTAGNKAYQVKALNQLGQELIGENTKEAIVLLKQALVLTTKANMTAERLASYHSLRLATKAQGNLIESLRYAEEEISLAKVLQKEKEERELIQEKSILDSQKMERELNSLKEKTRLDQLKLAKKNSEIEIAEQANKISELELTKNKYASFTLALLLAICFLVVIFLYRRFSDSRKRNRELDYLAARDPLTNCYNRRILFDLMNRDFEDLELFEQYSVIMVDIDHFKTVNDTYGHNAGDAVIRGVASVLQECVRQNDIVARFGGEEFCLLLPRAAESDAMRISENIRQKVENSRFNDITVTCSLGVTSIKFNAKTPTEFINQADLALYKSKSNGRNQVTLWDRSLERSGVTVGAE